MKKVFSVIMILLVSLQLCACGTTAEPAKESDTPAAEAGFLDSASLYAPGVTVKTNFGEITILDAAFCGKAQLIEALPQPAYNTAGDGRIVFAMRTRISNTSAKDLVMMDDLKVTVQYGKEETYGCSKGGKYKSSDPLYTVLPAGESGEYIICGRVPVEVYKANKQFSVSFNGEKLKFEHDQLQSYNSMGYQEGDNLLTTMETLMAAAGTAPAETKKPDAKTEPIHELAFALEDARYEVNKNYFTVELKIRNNSNVFLEWPTFNGMILDANGDILENCFCSYTNGLEAGQAGWDEIRISEPETLEAMDTIKIVTVWYKETPESKTHGLRFDLPEPFIIKIGDLKQK